jgi:hypothetical protein
MSSSPKNLERWDIYSDEWKRYQNGRMEQSKAMDYGSQKASPDFLKPRNIYIYIYICYTVVAVSGACRRYLVLKLTRHPVDPWRKQERPRVTACSRTTGANKCQSDPKAFRRPSSWFHSYSEENLFFFFNLPSCRLDCVTAANSVYVMQMTHRSTALLPVSTACSYVGTLQRSHFALSLFISKYVSMMGIC